MEMANKIETDCGPQAYDESVVKSRATVIELDGR